MTQSPPSPERSPSDARRRSRRAAPTPPVYPADEVLAAALERWQLSDLELSRFRQVLLHTSAVAPKSVESNERLEFLGDALVNTVVAEYLYSTYLDRAEGDLAKGRALVVSKVSLYEVGARLGLQDLIVVGANTEGILARGRRSLVADAVEALIAAVYLQFGWERAREFTLRIIAPELEAVRVREDLRDAKTILQEQAQALRQPTPEYKIVSEQGDAHARTYMAEVTLHGGLCATGAGRSKKDAHQAAATAALALIRASNPE